MVPSLSVEQLQEKLTNHEKICLLDVRQDWEYDLCSLPASLHIPLTELEDRLGEIPTSYPVVVICHHGVRSQQAGGTLIKAGFKTVFSLAGGLDAWARQIDPTIGVY